MNPSRSRSTAHAHCFHPRSDILSIWPNFHIFCAKKHEKSSKTFKFVLKKSFETKFWFKFELARKSYLQPDILSIWFLPKAHGASAKSKVLRNLFFANFCDFWRKICDFGASKLFFRQILMILEPNLQKSSSENPCSKFEIGLWKP